MAKRNRLTVHPSTIERAETLLAVDDMDKDTFDAKLNTIFDRLDKAHVTPGQMFTALGLTAEEQTFVLDVFNASDLNFAQEMRLAMLARCKTLAKAYARLDSVNFDNPEERKGLKGTAERRLHEVVTELMAANDSASHARATVYLSLQLLKTVAHSGKSQVVAYRRKHAATLAKHHAKHGWMDDTQGNRHNRMVSEKYKALVGDEIADDA